MDPEWLGPGWYRPSDGSHWTEASVKTEWMPCENNNEFGRDFRSYETFKQHKQKLRLKGRLNKWVLRLKD